MNNFEEKLKVTRYTMDHNYLLHNDSEPKCFNGRHNLLISSKTVQLKHTNL